MRRNNNAAEHARDRRTLASRKFVVFEKTSDIAEILDHGHALPHEDWDDHTYRHMVVTGYTFQEPALRAWATAKFGVALDADLEAIAQAIAEDGWLLLTLIEGRSDAP